MLNSHVVGNEQHALSVEARSCACLAAEHVFTLPPSPRPAAGLSRSCLPQDAEREVKHAQKLDGHEVRSFSPALLASLRGLTPKRRQNVVRLLEVFYSSPAKEKLVMVARALHTLVRIDCCRRSTQQSKCCAAILSSNQASSSLLHALI